MKRKKEGFYLVCGKGINDYEGSVTYNGVMMLEYDLWKGMLRRCYMLSDKHKTYAGCSVEDYLLSFENFRNFIKTLKGFNCRDNNGQLFHLDKDLLLKGNKQYNRDTICFIPTYLNSFITKTNAKRGELPVGVYLDKRSGKFKSQLSIDGTQIYLGRFDTEIEAFIAYKQAKENRAKELAEIWKDDVDSRVYKALMEYEVSVDD